MRTFIFFLLLAGGLQAAAQDAGQTKTHEPVKLPVRRRTVTYVYQSQQAAQDLRRIDPIMLSGGYFSECCSAFSLRYWIPVCGLAYAGAQQDSTIIVPDPWPVNAQHFGPYIRLMGVSGLVFTHTELMRLPQRNINAIAGLTAGVDSRAGSTPNIKGARAEGTAYYVDGVRTLEPLQDLNVIK